jgi:branched-chain amino acid transport system ATP-binding protein
MADTPLLDVADLEVVYNHANRALHGVSLTVPERGTVAILGANGAGKTTTLRAISGFAGLDNARIAQGHIRYRGVPLQGLPPDRVARRGIALVPERDKVFPNLTVSENLTAVGSSASGAARRRYLEARVFDYFPRLVDLRSKEAGLLSGGERQMLAIGTALVCGPELLLIDELSQGLAPVLVGDLARRLIEIRRDLGITILLVEQSASVALQIADYLYVLENGVVAFKGTPDQLQDNDAMRRAYLGGPREGRVNYRETALRRLSEAPDG